FRLGAFPGSGQLPFFIAGYDKTFVALPRLLHVLALAYVLTNLDAVEAPCNPALQADRADGPAWFDRLCRGFGDLHRPAGHPCTLRNHSCGGWRASDDGHTDPVR